MSYFVYVLSVLLVAKSIGVHAACTKTHVIASGNTCNSIADYYGLNFNAFILANKPINCQGLTVGNSVCVGSDTINMAKVATLCTQTRTIAAGETCASLQSIPFFYSINPGIISICDNLQVGQVICTSITAQPVQPAIPDPMSSYCTKSYTVQQWDTCNSITDAFLLDFNAFILANKPITCQNLYPGNQVCIQSSLFPMTRALYPCAASKTIQSGETCTSLSTAYPNFYLLNPGISYICDNLQFGQKVCIA